MLRLSTRANTAGLPSLTGTSQGRSVGVNCTFQLSCQMAVLVDTGGKKFMSRDVEASLQQARNGPLERIDSATAAGREAQRVGDQKTLNAGKTNLDDGDAVSAGTTRARKAVPAANDATCDPSLADRLDPEAIPGSVATHGQRQSPDTAPATQEQDSKPEHKPSMTLRRTPS